jgi:retron-type reverse transcriptase
MRTLNIPTIKDRVVHMAIKLIIEPIFEADFKEHSYGYRPKKSAHQAIATLNNALFLDIYRAEHRQKVICSIDLADCFDTIPHRELIRLIAERVIDRKLLGLIKAILKAGAGKPPTSGSGGRENKGDAGGRGTLYSEAGKTISTTLRWGKRDNG